MNGSNRFSTEGDGKVGFEMLVQPQS